MLWLALLSALAAEPASRDTLLERAQVFPSRVELVAVELIVVDGDGRPIPDLGPSDFELQVEGRPRNVVSAEFVPVAQEAEEAPAGPADTGFTTNETVRPGRLVLLVVDTDNIELFSGRDTMRAASKVLGRLGPADRVGLVTIPTSGPREEFTSEHERVAKALDKVVGRGTLVGKRASISEAAGLMAGGPSGASNDPNAWAMAQTADTDRWQLRLEYESVSSRSRAMIKAAFDALRPLSGQKVLVLVSQGLGFPETLERPGIGGSELCELVAAATAAHVAFYVVPVAARSPLPSIDSDLDVTTLALDRQLHLSGLEMLAEDAGGAILRGEPERAFERVLRETSGYYRLGFEPEGRDRDGKAQSLRVAVTRKGAVVRARPTDVFRRATASNETNGDLASALRSPTLASGLPLRVATWSLAAPEPGKVKLLVGAEIGGEAEPHGLAVGYVLLDARGKIVASARQSLLDGVRPAVGPIPYSASAVVAPGVYRLRVAVRDGRGRIASVEHPVAAGLVRAGPLTLSDLLLGRAPEPAKAFRPAIAPEASGDGLFLRGEVYGEEGSALDSATATLDVVSSETGASVHSSAARLAPASTPGRRVVQLRLPVADLAPGRYLARIVLASDGAPRGAVVRPFRVVARLPAGALPE
jgi:VWFA-related protein